MKNPPHKLHFYEMFRINSPKQSENAMFQTQTYYILHVKFCQRRHTIFQECCLNSRNTIKNTVTHLQHFGCITVARHNIASCFLSSPDRAFPIPEIAEPDLASFEAFFGFLHRKSPFLSFKEFSPLYIALRMGDFKCDLKNIIYIF